MKPPDLAKAALRGEPSHVWRAGQERRWQMIRRAAPMLVGGRALADGCGVGMYMRRLAEEARCVHGLDIEFDRLLEAKANLVGAKHRRSPGAASPLCPSPPLVHGAGERLPYASDSFDLVLSHEVIEHVQDDRAAVAEMVRVLRPGGRLALFCPNRWYPVETHGIYWRGQYRFGNIPLVNYLPNALRDRLAPHVRAYTGPALRRLFHGLPARVVSHSVIFGGYDNLIARLGPLGRLIRAAFQAAERSPLRALGLSHFLVVEKTEAQPAP